MPAEAVVALHAPEYDDEPALMVCRPSMIVEPESVPVNVQLPLGSTSVNEIAPVGEMAASGAR